MSIINEFNALRQGGSDTIRFPVRVTGYTIDAKAPVNSRLTGVRLDTQEEVSVFLRENKGAGQHPRPEIADLKKPRPGMQNEAVGEGGIVRVDGAYFDRERDAWSARWVTTITHAPEQGSALVAPARVMLYRNESGHLTGGAVDIAFNDRAISIDRAEDFAGAMVSALDPGESRGRPAALVRVRDASGNSTSFSFYNKREQVGENEWRTPTGKEAFAAVQKTALWKGITAKVAEASAAEAGLTVEVVPVRRVNIGPKSLKDGLDQAYRMQVGEGESARHVTAFAQSVIGLRYAGENKEDFIAISVVPVHYDPELNADALVSPAQSRPGPEAAATAPDVPDVELGDLSDLDEAPAATSTPRPKAAMSAAPGL